MKTIREPNDKVIAFIKTNSPESEGLRRARWTESYSGGGVNLMKNLFSGEIVRLTDEEFAKPECVQQLVMRRFIVPDDYDETAKYLETVRLVRLMQPERPGLKTYTILPTTGCNARCTYCYEQGYAVSTMTPETADRIAEFICSTRCDGRVKLRWFGGEPLLGHKNISRICGELEKRGVDFRSEMITNASLMTKQLAHEAKVLWRLEKVQVSLDGEKSDYTLRKQYIDPARHNYDVVMQAIHFLADEDIKVQLRVNFDKENLANMQSFIDEMESEFGGCANVSMYLYMLFQQQHKADCVQVYRSMFELFEANSDSKILCGFKSGSKVKFNHCMADSLDKSVVISPDGRLHRCEHLPGNDKSWGNVFDGVTDKELLGEMMQQTEPDEKCCGCGFLPVCTPFFRKGCPDYFEHCAEYQKLKVGYELKMLAREEAREKR